MERLFLEEIARAVKGKVIFGKPDIYCDSAVIDSRKVTQGSLFIGIKGEAVDGNDYVFSAFEQGSTIAIVEKYEDIIPSETKGLILVDSSRQALADLAKYYRSRLKAKFLVITGSTGKTTVKDMLHGMLSKRYKVFKTKGNYNNELGLPLMLMEMDNSYDMAVLEMGMSGLGEIHFLSDIVRQDAALITNIGITHIELLKTRDNIFRAKMEITDFFGKENTLYTNAEDEYLRKLHDTGYRLVAAGIENGDYRAADAVIEKDHVEFNIMKGNRDLGRIRINAPGRHNVINGILAFACANEYGIEPSMIKELDFDRTSMRLQENQFENLTVINDAYNASPDSMKAGLDQLTRYEGRKVAIVGDMKELGDFASMAHKDCGIYARDKADVMIAVGSFNDQYEEGYGNKDFYRFDTFEEAERGIPQLLKKGDVVYLKASRSMGFERFLGILERF